MQVLRITDWDKHFENNRTRELKRLDWIPFPNKHDGDGYSELLDHPDGAAHYGCWCVIVQVASKCDERGTLLRDGARPHTAASLARMTRFPADLMAAAIRRLIEIGWLELNQYGATDTEEVAAGCDIPAPDCGKAPMEWKGMEGNGREENTPLTPRLGGGDSGQGSESTSDEPETTAAEVVRAWNSWDGVCHVETPLRGKRERTLNARLREPRWRESWAVALARCRANAFFAGDNERGWRATLDWFIRPDTVAKILEGQYERSHANQPRNGNGGLPPQARATRIRGDDLLAQLERERTAAAGDAASGGE
jgi:hypothetical protein